MAGNQQAAPFLQHKVSANVASFGNMTLACSQMNWEFFLDYNKRKGNGSEEDRKKGQ